MLSTGQFSKELPRDKGAKSALIDQQIFFVLVQACCTMEKVVASCTLENKFTCLSLIRFVPLEQLANR